MRHRSLLYAYSAFILAVTVCLQPANAGSFNMASNTTYETRIETTQTAHVDYADKACSHELRSKDSRDAASGTSLDKEYDLAYQDFSKAFRLKNHGNEESVTSTDSKSFLYSLNQVTLAVNTAIQTLLDFIEN